MQANICSDAESYLSVLFLFKTIDEIQGRTIKARLFGG
jgi:hypothetical protein